jgi:hypothetical protein
VREAVKQFPCRCQSGGLHGTAASQHLPTIERQGRGLADLRRQAASLEAASSDLKEAGRVALAAESGRAVLVKDLGALADAAAEFRKRADGAADAAQLRDEFAAVNRNWAKAVEGLGALPPDDAFHLLRAAGRFDALHRALFERLGMTGERPARAVRS